MLLENAWEICHPMTPRLMVTRIKLSGTFNEGYLRPLPAKVLLVQEVERNRWEPMCLTSGMCVWGGESATVTHSMVAVGSQKILQTAHVSSG